MFDTFSVYPEISIRTLVVIEDSFKFVFLPLLRLSWDVVSMSSTG